MLKIAPLEQYLKERGIRPNKREHTVMQIKLLQSTFIRGEYVEAGAEIPVDTYEALYLIGRQIAVEVSGIVDGSVTSKSIASEPEISDAAVDISKLSKDDLLKEIEKRGLDIGYENNKETLRASIELFDKYDSYEIKKLHSFYKAVRLPAPIEPVESNRLYILNILVWHGMLFDNYKQMTVGDLDSMIVDNKIPVKRDQKKRELILDIIRYEFLKDSNKDEILDILRNLGEEASIHEKEEDLIIKVMEK